MKKNNRKTLGNNIVPKNYRLVFEPNFNTFKFSGTESISIAISKPANTIKLNSSELEIKNAVLEANGIKQHAKITKNEKEETVTLSFDRAAKGNGELKVNFNGIHNEKMYGFYRSKYMNNGKEDYILTTQFEAADARKAYPCFDEPEFKATYDVSFVIDKGLSGISNMPIKNEKSLGKGKKIVSFYTTPKMSSYLLYLGVGKFEFLAEKYKKLTFRVVTVPGKSKSAKLALDYGKKFLKYYEDYFGIDFPLPKMDLLAIPDFSAGAMENWGAITLGEIEMLGDEKTTSIARKQRIAEVIAHELAHQWFGDLVTMKWWDDLWLNESFATFMATKAVDTVFPKWEFGLQDHTETMSTALSADQYVSTHPINVTVNEPSEIDEIFDRISYEKGGTVLAMLEDYVGEETFRKGLHNYLKKHSYSNATKYDLWNAIGEIARKKDKHTKFAKVAMDWVDKTGYPVINLIAKNDTAAMEQSRYTLLDNRKFDEIWPIPVHYLTKGNKNNFMLLENRSAKLKINRNGYIKLNHTQKGMYRVRYEDQMLGKLGPLIKSNDILPVDAWGIENDLYSFARSSRISVTAYLDFVEGYCLNGDYPLNFSVSGHLNGLSILLCDNKKLLKRINALNIRYHKAVLGKLGWTESKTERNITTIFRTIAISSLGASGYKSVVDRANKMFMNYLKTGKPLPKNLKGAIYGVVAWNGNESTYNKFVELYLKETVPEDKRKFLVALASSRRPELINKALKFSLSRNVRLQDGFVVNAVASSNEVGKKLVWTWLKTNWKELLDRYSTGTHMMPTFINSVGLVDDQKTKDEIEAFFAIKGNRRKDMERALKQTLEHIGANIRFKAFNDT